VTSTLAKTNRIHKGQKATPKDKTPRPRYQVSRATTTQRHRMKITLFTILHDVELGITNGQSM